MALRNSPDVSTGESGLSRLARAVYDQISLMEQSGTKHTTRVESVTKNGHTRYRWICTCGRSSPGKHADAFQNAKAAAGYHVAYASGKVKALRGKGYGPRVPVNCTRFDREDETYGYTFRGVVIDHSDTGSRKWHTMTNQGGRSFSTLVEAVLHININQDLYAGTRQEIEL